MRAAGMFEAKQKLSGIVGRAPKASGLVSQDAGSSLLFSVRPWPTSMRFLWGWIGFAKNPRSPRMLAFRN